MSMSHYHIKYLFNYIKGAKGVISGMFNGYLNIHVHTFIPPGYCMVQQQILLKTNVSVNKYIVQYSLSTIFFQRKH